MWWRNKGIWVVVLTALIINEAVSSVKMDLQRVLDTTSKLVKRTPEITADSSSSAVNWRQLAAVETGQLQQAAPRDLPWEEQEPLKDLTLFTFICCNWLVNWLGNWFNWF